MGFFFFFVMTTEWEDAQRRIGNLPPLESEVTIEEDVFENLVLEAARAKASHENDTLDELDEHIDNAQDDDEEDELMKIRRKRLQEMRAQQEKERFGDCSEISKSQFVSEVSEDSKKYKVLVLFSEVAENCKHIKFLYMKEEKRVAPMIVCYEGVEPTFTIRPDPTKIREADELEWVMAQNGLIETDLQEDPRIHSGNHRVHINIQRKEKSAVADVA